VAVINLDGGHQEDGGSVPVAGNLVGVSFCLQAARCGGRTRSGKPLRWLSINRMARHVRHQNLQEISKEIQDGLQVGFKPDTSSAV
jgi:hypothetical protein